MLKLVIIMPEKICFSFFYFLYIFIYFVAGPPAQSALLESCGKALKICFRNEKGKTKPGRPITELGQWQLMAFKKQANLVSNEKDCLAAPCLFLIRKYVYYILTTFTQL